MPDFLVFTLAAPMASFGTIAGNFSRGSDFAPGHSLIVGLLGAALGLEREDERLLALSEGLRVAHMMESRGAPLRDFHTVQSRKEKKGVTPRTRREALAGDKYTTLSERDYLCDVLVRVAVMQESGPFTLDEMKAALERPRFTLYLGRKSCPLALPPSPRLIAAEDAQQALHLYRKQVEAMKHPEPWPLHKHPADVLADARLFPAASNARRSRRRTEPGARSIWAYRLLEELTLHRADDPS